MKYLKVISDDATIEHPEKFILVVENHIYPVAGTAKSFCFHSPLLSQARTSGSTSTGGKI